MAKYNPKGQALGKTPDSMKIQCGKAGELLAWPLARGERLQPGTAPCHCPTSTAVTIEQSLCQGALGPCLDTDPKKRLCQVVEKHLECAKAQGSITRGRPWASSSRNFIDLQVPCVEKGRVGEVYSKIGNKFKVLWNGIAESQNSLD